MAAKDRIEVNLRYFNTIADLTGKPRERCRLDKGACLADLIQVLRARYKDLAIYLDSEGFHGNYPLRLFCNSQLVLNLDQALAQDDNVLIFPVISGG